MRRAPLVLLLSTVSALSGGCIELTRFDYPFDDEDASIDSGAAADAGGDAALTDAGPDASRRVDAGRDSGADAGAGLDAGPGDAGFPASPCPAPCLGDLYDDVIDGQNTPSGAAGFRFRADDRGALGIAASDLTWDSVDERWEHASVGTSVTRCEAGACPGQDPRSFVLASTTPEPAAFVEWIAPSTGSYRVGGVARELGVAASRLVISREHRHDLVRELAVPTEAAAALEFDVTLSLIAGDVVRVLAERVAAGPSEVALALWVSGPTGGADTCQVAADFDDWSGAASDALQVQCPAAGVDVELSARIGAARPSETTSVSGEFGSAIALASVDTSFARLRGLSGARADLSGDFTLQLWARLDDNSSLFNTFVSNVETEGGQRYVGGVYLETGDFTNAHVEFGASLSEPDDRRRTSTFQPDGGWHFYRLVRSGSVLTLCVDGVDRGQRDVGAGDLGTARSFTLGRFGGEPPQFDGALDEVRLYGGALPCALTP